MKRKAEDDPESETESKRIKLSSSPGPNLEAPEAPKAVPFPEKVCDRITIMKLLADCSEASSNRRANR